MATNRFFCTKWKYTTILFYLNLDFLWTHVTWSSLLISKYRILLLLVMSSKGEKAKLQILQNFSKYKEVLREYRGVRGEYHASTREYEKSTREYEGSTREYEGSMKEVRGSMKGVRGEYGSTEISLFPPRMSSHVCCSHFSLILTMDLLYWVISINSLEWNTEVKKSEAHLKEYSIAEELFT